VGCGTGIATDAFQCKATGIDPSKKLLEIAKKKHPGPTYLLGSAEKLPFPDNSFDILLSVTALQNIINEKDALQEIKRVGKNQFILSFLKKSHKAFSLMKSIKELFSIVEIIDEEKDIIIIAQKK